MANIHIKTAFGYIRRSPFQAASAIFVLSLTFFVATMVSVLLYSTSKLLVYFETRPQIIAFLKDEAVEVDIKTLESKLSVNTNIKDIKYISKAQALEIYKKATNDNPLLGQLVSPSIFPASLEFSVKDLSLTQGIIEDIKKESIVDSVGFTAAVGGQTNLDDVVERLKSVTRYVRWGGATFTISLALVSFAVLLVTITMRLSTRKEEIEILNLIGATKKFIRSPIILEAGIYTFVGVVVGWIVAFIAVLYLAPNIVSYFGDIPVLPKDIGGILTLFGMILGVEVVLGIILALGGSLLAISRVKKVR